MWYSDMNPTSKKILITLKEYAIITFGLALYCFSWTAFLIPKGIVGGAIPGLATFVNYATGGLIPVSVTYLSINVVLLILGFLILGRGFGFKTIYVILLSTVLFKVLPEYECLVAYFDERLVVAVVGGIVEAVGIGIVLLRGGSSGGTDIAAMVINKYWPVSPGKVYLYSDLFIIASVLLIPGKTIEDMIYGYATMVTFSLMIDAILLGRKSSVQILVFSSKYDEVADFIMKNMDRGVTALYAQGWYSQKDNKVLLIVAYKTQLHQIVSAVKRIDPKAFVSVSTATSVYGEGFEEIKTGIKLKQKENGNA